jgi:capping protein (actin filament) muscle Z-line, alpha
VDPRSKTSFQFDHLRLDASDSQPFEINAKAETMRSALESATLAYIKDHFYDGVATVLASPLREEDAAESIDYIIQIVGNKYNPANYW